MKKLFLVCSVLCCTLQLAAQQYGHLNFGNLLAQMPQTEAADGKIQALNDSLVTAGEALATTLQANIEAYQTAVQSGGEAPIQLAEREKVIRQQQQGLAAFEQNAQQQIEARRAALLGPVIQAARDAIEAVAKEKGLILVFDTSLFNAVLFADETLDIMPFVKAKLGIKDE